MTEGSRDRDTGVSNGRFEELTARLREQFASRREFLADSAAVGGGALAFSLGGAGTAAAASDEHQGDGETTGDGGDGQARGADPVDVLNYALTLEQLEATFYEEGLDQFNPTEFQEAEFASACQNEVDETIHARLIAIRDHEQAHVDVITATINDLGGDPVTGIEFEFPYENVDEFVELAAVLETTGVSAYTGAINLLQKDELLTAAATIATVEGRHSAYLNDLDGQNPFPRAFDQPRSMDEITETISGFIVSDGSGGTDGGAQDGGSEGGG